MVLYLSKEEYKKLSQALSSTKNPILVKGFNHIFECDEKSKIYAHPTPDKEGVVLTVDARLFKDVMTILAANGEELNKIFTNNVPISQIPSILSSLKRIRDCIVVVFKRSSV